MAPRRRRGSGQPDGNQLSFFDPRGQLASLTEEARLLAEQEVHRHYLTEALDGAEGRARECAENLATAERDAERAGDYAPERFEIAISLDGESHSLSDRQAAGEMLLAALRSRQQEIKREGGLSGIGELSGFTLGVHHVRGGSERSVYDPVLRGPGGTAYSLPPGEAEFGVGGDALSVIAAFERIIGEAVPEAFATWRDALVYADDETEDYRRQLSAIPAFDADRLANIWADITAIDSGAGGLFAANDERPKPDRTAETTATINPEETDHAPDNRTERAPLQPLRGQAQNVLPGELPGSLRDDAEEGRTGQLLRGDRQTGGGDVRDAGGSDESQGGGDRQPGREDELHQPHTAGGGRDGPQRYRLRQAVEADTARRRERARLNFSITPEHAISAGTPKEKVAANIAAIRIAKALAEDSRPATEGEKAALVRYVGWGAFAQAIFDKDPNSANAQSWRKERQELADLLTTEEWDAARASTLNAHYTSEEVIKGVWSALGQLGFTGGRVIEPALGAGHFIGLTPGNLRDEIAWTGVEIDPITGGIAAGLYPGADIRISPFEDTIWPDGFFDLAVSNVPFGNFGVSDRRYGKAAIHDYFFLKGIDKVRPGGLIAFITSRYTLDKSNPSVRQAMSSRAEFLGAIRLPGGKDGAFARNAGTDVTTDIIFLRRRAEGEGAGNERWLGLTEIETPDGPTAINAYFAENPQMMLGEMRLQGTMHSAAEPVLIGEAEGLEARIAEAAKTMRANAFVPRGAEPFTAKQMPRLDAEAGGVKEGAFYRKDGEIYRKLSGIGVVQDFSRADAAKLTALIEMRDVVSELLGKQARGDETGRTELRAALNRSYDGFHRNYGPINKMTVTTSSRTKGDGTPVTIRKFPNFALFRDDPDAFKVAAIEIYDATSGAAAKAVIFSHDIIQPAVMPVVTSASDALALSLNERGMVDIALIGHHLGVSGADAVDMLADRAWLDPAGDIWRTSEDYLSGDVVRKLEDARAAAEIEERYHGNVEALEAVQPQPLTRADINILFGAPWLPIDIVSAFLTDLLHLPADALAVSEVTQKWLFTKKPVVPASTAAQYGVPRASVPEIVLAALNNGDIRIYDRPAKEGDSPVYNPSASEEANTKVREIREAFSGSAEEPGGGWVWADETRAARLEAVYNRAFNRLMPTVYDGSHMTLPGIVRFVKSDKGDIIPFKLQPHQLNAVWRIAASGNTLIDHAVGAGKTFTMIAAGMEQKRLGLVRRPMYVVPNHMLEQFSREFLQAYPAATLLVADKSAMGRDKRREFAARAATADWDGIVITHDAFGRIGMSDEVYGRFIGAELNELREFKVRAAAEEGKNSPTVKDLERASKRLEARLADLTAKERKDDGVTFEELGVDFLFVDEAHSFKNLGFRTRHVRVKGLAAVESQRATDLFLKIRYLEERHPGRSVVFATGTPIANTIAEMYTMQRYLQPGLLRDYGIDGFDAWAATFGDIVTQVELAPNGRDFRTVRSFSRFVNIPELIALYSRVADTQTADMLNLPRPKLRGGGIQVVEAGLSDVEAAIMESLVARAEAIKGKRAEVGGDNMLKIMSEGLKLATDIRLLNPAAAANPHGKIAKAVENIHRIWKDGQDPALAQIVFLDMGVPGSRAGKGAAATEAEADDGIAIIPVDDDDTDAGEDSDAVTLSARFNLYEDLRARLVATGVPRDAIAFIHDANSDEKKGALFAAVRRGDIRVLIGSTGKMGVGTNVQERLIAMHHLDAPWRPADVEQRDGRILRQGNRNAEIDIFRYITLKSLDAYRWQTLSTKAQFIAQIRAGAKGLRTASDIDSPLPEAAMIKAAATGDPRIMEHAELSKDVRLLDAYRRTHERSIIAARTAHQQTADRITSLQDGIANAKEDVARIPNPVGEDFAVALTLHGERRISSGRRAAGETVKAHLLREGASYWHETARVEIVGELSGFEMRAALRRREGALSMSVLIGGRLEYGRGEWFALTGETDGVGLIRRFEGLIRGIPRYLAKQEESLAKVEAELPRFERQRHAAAFAKQAQLDAGKKRLAELEAALKPKQQNGAQAMQQDPRNAEWAKLDEAAKAVARDVVAEALETGQSARVDHGGAEVYAYPHPGGGIAWGLNGATTGNNEARGILSGQELAEELNKRRSAQNGGGLAEPDNAARSDAAGKRLNPEEDKHLGALRKAGVDEDAFHSAFSNLASDPGVKDSTLLDIAKAYAGEHQALHGRQAALGAIETAFYAGQKQAAQSRQHGGRGA